MLVQDEVKKEKEQKVIAQKMKEAAKKRKAEEKKLEAQKKKDAKKDAAERVEDAVGVVVTVGRIWWCGRWRRGGAMVL